MRTRLTLALLLPLASAFGAGETQQGGHRGSEEARPLDLARLGTRDEYRVDDYLQAAQALQAMGKEKAGAKLLDLAKHDRWPHIRTLALCRILFTAKPQGSLRRAAIGGALFPFGDYGDWPDEPVYFLDGVPFLIPCGYELQGRGEPAVDYVNYCLKSCDWKAVKLRSLTKEEKQNALAKIRLSPKLKGLEETFKRS